MTNDDRWETELDAAIEAVARPEPPASHLGQVLAVSGPTAGAVPSRRFRPTAIVRPRWALPVAATLAIAGIVTARAARQVPLPWPGAEPGAGARPAWGAPRDVDRPVLPPEMYWAMDPFAEFATLRPAASRRHDAAPTRPDLPARFAAAAVPPALEGGVPRAADDEQVLPAVPADLPEITLATIIPAPVDVVPLPQPAPITLAGIALAPIAVAPIDIQMLIEEENP